MNDRISVIVPVYKAEKYLPQCIDSILAQTYRNLEIILVDDGSPDRCGEICDEYARRDARIRVIHQQNRGVSAARNAGINSAVGAYIGFVDADDWIEPDMYERLHEWIVRERTSIVACGWMFDKEETGRSHPNQLLPSMRLCGDKILSNVIRGDGFGWVIWNKLFNQGLFEDFGLRFDEDVFYSEDALLALRSMLIVSEAYYSPKQLYHYRIHQGSATRTFNERIITEITARRRIIELIEGRGEDLSDLAKGLYSASAASIRAHAMMHGRKELAKKLGPEARRYCLQYFKRKEIATQAKVKTLMKLLFPLASLTFWTFLKNFRRRRHRNDDGR